MRFLLIFTALISSFAFSQQEKALEKDWSAINPFTKDIREDEQLVAYRNLPLPIYRQILSDTFMKTVGTFTKAEDEGGEEVVHICVVKYKDLFWKIRDGLRGDENAFWSTHPSFAPQFPPFFKEKELRKACQWLEKILAECRTHQKKDKKAEHLARSTDTAFGDINSAIHKSFSKAQIKGYK